MNTLCSTNQYSGKNNNFQSGVIFNNSLKPERQNTPYQTRSEQDSFSTNSLKNIEGLITYCILTIIFFCRKYWITYHLNNHQEFGSRYIPKRMNLILFRPLSWTILDFLLLMEQLMALLFYRHKLRWCQIVV